MFKRLILINAILSLLLLSACGVSVGSQPKEIRDDIWEVSRDTYYEVIESTIDGELLSEYRINSFDKVFNKYRNSDEQISEEEYSMIMVIGEMIYLNEQSVKSFENTDIDGMKEQLTKFGELRDSLREYFPEK